MLISGKSIAHRRCRRGHGVPVRDLLAEYLGLRSSLDGDLSSAHEVPMRNTWILSFGLWNNLGFGMVFQSFMERDDGGDQHSLIMML